MNLPRYSLDNAKVIYFFLALLLVGGLISFGRLGKKEDSPFVIKSASIVTRYPGATPEEVEKLVTEPIGREIQSMRRVYKITSESYYGLSKIMIELDPATPADEMPQIVGRAAPQGAQYTAPDAPGCVAYLRERRFRRCVRDLLRPFGGRRVYL